MVLMYRYKDGHVYDMMYNMWLMVFLQHLDYETSCQHFVNRRALRPPAMQHAFSHRLVIQDNHYSHQSSTDLEPCKVM
ncbi:hypothetical protein AVEN_54983-1 [Araneus ventricosus]|uniref:Uncharacterized protein n=1 Tax=Araneus ventricosus TaxID=182803 RepID=A0A4Y2MV68_ARAVE|nr:hypothetical protein AVEN_54983-1 [Araneus ventricosus]